MEHLKPLSAGSSLVPKLVAVTSLLSLCVLASASPFVPERLFGVGDATEVGAITQLRRISVNDRGDWASSYLGSFGFDGLGSGVLTSTGVHYLPGSDHHVYDGGRYLLGNVWDVDISPDGGLAIAASARSTALPPVILDGVILDGQAYFDLPESASSYPYNGSVPARYGVPRYIEYITGGEIVISTQSPDMPSGPHLGVNFISRLSLDGDSSWTDQTLGAPGLEVGEGRSIFRLEGSQSGTRINRQGDVVVQAGLFGSPWGIGSVRNGLLLFDGASGVPDIPEGNAVVLRENSMIDHNDEGDWVAAAAILDADYNTEPILFSSSGEILMRGYEPQPWFDDRYIIPGTVDLVDNGNLIWAGSVYEDLSSPDNQVGLFWNQELILLTGDTIIDGQVVDFFSFPGGSSFEVSPNGEWVALRVGFEDGSDAFYRIKIPSPASPLLIIIISAHWARRRRT